METTTYKLKDVLKIGNGKDHSSLPDGEYPVLGSGGIMRYANRYLYDGESVLLPRKGTLNNIQYIKGKFWTVDTCYYTIINQDITHPYYLYRLLRTFDLSGLDSGASIPSMTSKTYYGIKVQLPPLPTQQKIASILSAYDNLIQNYKKQIEALQTAASQLYKEWFVRFRFPGWQNAKFENGIPEGWKVEKVKDCVNRLPFGQTYKKDELEPEGKVIVIDQSEDEYLGYHNNEPSHTASPENPIALFGDHSCKYKLMIKDFSLGENIIPYISKGVDLYYLYYSVYKIVQTEEYKRHWNLFVNKKVLIPNTELQKSFRQKVIPIFKQIEILNKQITNLTQQRDLLLPRLMSGKLEVE
ncbi:MAG: restriction endonuclease subunit S [Treponema sp.]|nr:restriction endonuclease subunit S [Treponema sp.]